MECSICYEVMLESKKLACAHEFHEGCIGAWFKKAKTCPMCRAPSTSGELGEIPILISLNQYDYEWDSEFESFTAAPLRAFVQYALIYPENSI
jgi:hypothetical protein